MRWLLWVGLLCGCDSVFGLSGDPRPCDGSSFDQVTPTDVTPAEDFSISWDRSLAVLVVNGETFEMTLPAGDLQPIDLGVYVDVQVSLDPEGDALLYTAAIEPPLLQGALRLGNAQWSTGAQVPVGTYAGTPSADAFGPRRLLVMMKERGDLREYEDQDGHWVAIGDPHMAVSSLAPNLTPNGLSMVFTAKQADDTSAVFIANRASVDEWFGDPVMILAGNHTNPQLLDKCRQLYTIDGDVPAGSQTTMLRKYER